jgi:hypothetical protein
MIERFLYWYDGLPRKVRIRPFLVILPFWLGSLIFMCGSSRSWKVLPYALVSIPFCVIPLLEGSGTMRRTDRKFKRLEQELRHEQLKDLN